MLELNLAIYLEKWASYGHFHNTYGEDLPGSTSHYERCTQFPKTLCSIEVLEGWKMHRFAWGHLVSTYYELWAYPIYFIWTKNSLGFLILFN